MKKKQIIAHLHLRAAELEEDIRDGENDLHMVQERLAALVGRRKEIREILREVDAQSATAP